MGAGEAPTHSRQIEPHCFYLLHLAKGKKVVLGLKAGFHTSNKKWKLIYMKLSAKLLQPLQK